MFVIANNAVQYLTVSHGHMIYGNSFLRYDWLLSIVKCWVRIKEMMLPNHDENEKLFIQPFRECILKTNYLNHFLIQQWSKKSSLLPHVIALPFIIALPPFIALTPLITLPSLFAFPMFIALYPLVALTSLLLESLHQLPLLYQKIISLHCCIASCHLLSLYSLSPSHCLLSLNFIVLPPVFLTGLTHCSPIIFVTLQST